MAFIYIDESGQFTKRAAGKYFVAGSFTIGEPRRIAKRFRSWQVRRLPRKMRHQPEIKWSEADIGDSLRLKTIQFIADLDVRIRYIYLKRDNIPFEYWDKERLQSGRLYTNVIGELLEMYLPSGENFLHAFCDNRDLGKGFTKQMFVDELRARLAPKMPPLAEVNIQMCDSTGNRNVQIVDWITGAIAAYIEGKPLGKEYYRILRNNFLGDGRELFC